MPAAKETIGQIEYYSRAMKAPRIREAATRLADQARETGWTHEEYLAAVLSRESQPGKPPAPRSGPGPPDSRPGNHSRTSTSITSPASNATPSRTWPPALSSPKRPTSSCSDRPAPAKPTSPQGWAYEPPSSVTGSCSPPPSTGSPGSKQPTKADGCPRNWSGCAATA